MVVEVYQYTKFYYAGKHTFNGLPENNMPAWQLERRQSLKEIDFDKDDIINYFSDTMLIANGFDDK